MKVGGPGSGDRLVSRNTAEVERGRERGANVWPDWRNLQDLRKGFGGTRCNQEKLKYPGVRRRADAELTRDSLHSETFRTIIHSHASFSTGTQVKLFEVVEWRFFLFVHRLMKGASQLRIKTMISSSSPDFSAAA